MKNEKKPAKIKFKKEKEFKMPKWMDCSWRRIPCGLDECKICGPINRSRKRHIDAGEDPDDISVIMEDVGNNLKETLELVHKDAKRLGVSVETVDEEELSKVPNAEQFPLYRKIKRWRDGLYAIANEADRNGSFWITSEPADDLLWYANTILSKTYRQLTNRWEIDNGDEYGVADYDYTKYVLRECVSIVKPSMKCLASLDTPEQGKLIIALVYLEGIEQDLHVI
jgi:hypothetical protein